MPEERAEGRDTTRDRRRRQALGAQLRDPALELLGRGGRERPAEPLGERGQIAPVRLDRPRRQAGGGEGVEGL